MLHKNLMYAAFSPDGQRIVTASEYSQAKVWSASTGEEVTPAISHDDKATHVAFSPDSRLIATASYDGTARVWDASTGEAVTPPLKHEKTVNHVAFSPDGRWLVTASDDATARIWDISPDDRPVDELVALAAFVAMTRLRESTQHGSAAGLEPLPFLTSINSWNALSPKYPHDSAVAKSQEIGWHIQNYRECNLALNRRRALITS